MASGKAVGFVYKILITTRRERERESHYLTFPTYTERESTCSFASAEDALGSPPVIQNNDYVNIPCSKLDMSHQNQKVKHYRKISN
jgi:hypothetical protein